MNDPIAPAYLAELTLADIAIRILTLRNRIMAKRCPFDPGQEQCAALLCQLQDEYRRRAGSQ